MVQANEPDKVVLTSYTDFYLLPDVVVSRREYDAVNRMLNDLRGQRVAITIAPADDADTWGTSIDGRDDDSRTITARVLGILKEGLR